MSEEERISAGERDVLVGSWDMDGDECMTPVAGEILHHVTGWYAVGESGEDLGVSYAYDERLGEKLGVSYAYGVRPVAVLLDADAAAAITEHGMFSQAGGGVLLDRSVVAVVNLASGEPE